MNFKIYTDGSHFKGGKNAGRLGCGGVLVDATTNKEIDRYSLKLEPEFLVKNFGSSNCSNPTAEMIGVLAALSMFKDKIGKNDKVVIYADYIGVRDWMNGAWKIKETYIKNIKNQIDSEIAAQKLEGRIAFSWVKGHLKPSTNNDAYWNDVVDKLAKGE